MPNSMTGFGAAEGPVAGGRLRVEIRTVNHRYFNLAPKLPGDLSGARGRAARAAAAGLRPRARGGAGALDRVRPSAPAGSRWTSSGRALVAARLRELQSALGLAGDVTLELVARQPDVLSTASDGRPSRCPGAEVEPIVAQAAAECRAMRAREGEALAAELRHRLDLLEQRRGRDRARGRRSGWSRERDRLRGAVAQLLDGRQADESRLAQEIAFQADRLDITEELVRFRAHVAAVREALAGRPARRASSSASWRRSWGAR